MILARHISQLETRSRVATSLLGGLLFAIVASFIVVQSTAVAQTRPLEEEGPVVPSDPDRPMLLQADEMVYDNQNNRVTAKGNVEIYHGSYVLTADKVLYNQSTNKLTAEGNVRIKEPDGAIITADRITLTDDFRDGFIRSLKIVGDDDSRIGADRAVRESGETTIFENAWYTPCKACADNPNKPPTWRIKAVRVIHKKSEATIAYEKAKFEFFGKTLFYLPKFKHADPSVKRKSGFLIPGFGHSNELGTTVEVPYYFALAPNYDFTFSPVYTERRGVLWKGQWRHRTKNGRYSLDLAGIDETENDPLAPGNPDFRGSIKTAGDFKLNQKWDFGWDVTVESDDTFRRFYKLDSILSTERVSQVNLTQQSDRSYFDTSLYHFGALTFADTSTAESRVHPVIDYNYVAADPVLGGELAFNANVLSLSRENGADNNHVVGELKWRKQFTSRNGQVITPFASLRGDAYQVSNVIDPVTGDVGTEDTITRGMATAGIEYRYPFVKHGKNASHVIEPVAQFIARPNLEDQKDIPNEDARSLVFDDTLLFDTDKFSGYDRIETGTRANVGLQYTVQGHNGGYARAVVGQSYQIAGDNDFGVDSGLDTDRSDYVTGLYIRPLDLISFTGQARFDEKTFELRRTDVSTNINAGPVSASAIYSNLDAQPGLGIATDREEIQTQGAVQLTEHWSAFGHLRLDIERDARLSNSLGLRYADDCFALSVTYTETFVRDRDIQPDERVMLRFELKHLGAFNVDAGGI